MPFEVTLDEKRRLAVVIFRGVGSLAERGQALAQLLALRAQAEGVVWDARKATYPPTGSDARSVAEAMCTLRDFPRGIAIVAGGREPRSYGLARSIATIAALEGVRAQVFRDLRTARAWLVGRGSPLTG